MNRKKLIGTIIGVIMFGLLMAGATYAWLSFNANIVNATYNGHSVNYWVNYTNGTHIQDIPILSATATPTNTQKATITAIKPVGSLVDHLNIHLTTELEEAEDKILSSDAADDNDGVHLIHYALCKNTCSSNFTSAVATGTINNTSFSSASIAAGATETLDIYTDTTAFEGTNTNTAITTQYQVTYTMYFWIDAAELENRHIGKSYYGYIHASANQADQEETEQ